MILHLAILASWRFSPYARSPMRRRRARLALLVALGAVSPLLARLPIAIARPDAPVLHERVPPDAREDLALSVALDGQLPAAIRTPSGILSTPDPREKPRPSEPTYGPGNDHDTFTADRETKRPDVSDYDDPFTPSTAPFKRLDAFDGVRHDYKLFVRDEQLVQVPAGVSPGPGDEVFFADLVVFVESDGSVRIPSVGPGARIVRARLGVGAQTMPMHVMRDGADNWFLQAFRPPGPGVRARLVMEVAIAGAAFGGPFGDPSWGALPFVPPLPENVAREAAAVRSAIGVSRRMRPRQAVTKLVEYFRGFTDSDESPRGRGSVYLDLALSKKGVCRHRAFAFFVTALGLGIPARMVLNEAHAWVEVHDGTLWRRIDLGGAGRMTPAASDAVADRTAYEPPPDAFAWPQDAQRGGDMVTDGRARRRPSGASSANKDASGGATTRDRASTAATDLGAGGSEPPAGGPLSSAPAVAPSAAADLDLRPKSLLSLVVEGADAHRGRPLRISGTVRAQGESCPHVAVNLWLRAASTRTTLFLGTLATRDDGSFMGGIVVPSEAPLGDYDLIARTAGDARCGAGASE